MVPPLRVSGLEKIGSHRRNLLSRAQLSLKVKRSIRPRGVYYDIYSLKSGISSKRVLVDQHQDYLVRKHHCLGKNPRHEIPGSSSPHPCRGHPRRRIQVACLGLPRVNHDGGPVGAWYVCDSRLGSIQLARAGCPRYINIWL